MLATGLTEIDTAAAAQAVEFPPLQPVTAELFRAAFRGHPSGVAVVTADAEGSPVGMTVSSIASFSADPPMLVFSANRGASSTPALTRAHTVVVHFVDARQIALARLGATSGVDRFADIEWSRLPTGEPVYADALAWVRCRVASKIEAKASVLFMLEIIDVRVAEEPEGGEPPQPLVYHNRAWHVLGEHSLAPEAG